MNAVILAVIIMLVLSLARLNVVVSLTVAALVGGLVSGLSIDNAIDAFSNGLGNGANIALSYALLGAFAVAIEHSKLPDNMANKMISLLHVDINPRQKVRIKKLLFGGILLAAILSQNIIPVHIAFIPILIPPLLHVFHRLSIDRRLVACVLTFGLITPFMILPIGFGNIYLNEVVLQHLHINGLTNIDSTMIIQAMLIPAIGMIGGLLVAVFFSYAKPRTYLDIEYEDICHDHPVTAKNTALIVLAIIAAFAVQLLLGSIIVGALTGYIIFILSGIVHWRESNNVFIDGMKMMAHIGFIMITAAGFAAVMKATGHIDTLVQTSADLIGHSKALSAFVMLLIGLLITIGIGSSFSTVPIIAVVFVPLALQLGFSPLATIALVGTAGVLGDAGSPASDSTLGPTIGLNSDGQHDHIWDSVVPTFVHYNIPLILFGWIAAMML